MTAGELIAELAKHHPDMPVLLAVEFDDDIGEMPLPVELFAIDRVVGNDGIYLELAGGI